MMELIFVIVILGVLAGVAIPRLFVSRDDAAVSRLKTDLSSIRAGIETLRGKNIMSGVATYPSLGQGFENVIGNPIRTDSIWTSVPDNNSTRTTETFSACVAKGVCATFTYTRSNGRISCTDSTGKGACHRLGES